VFIQIDLDRKRVKLFGWRWHHGATGALGLAASIALIVHDWRDRWWRPTRD
jgi:hypothetical protein